METVFQPANKETPCDGPCRMRKRKPNGKENDMKKKIARISSLCLASMMFLSACGQPTQSASGSTETSSSTEAAATEESGDGEKVKIVEWSQGEKVLKLKQEIIEQVFPNIDYEYVLVNNNDYLTKLQTALATGTDVPDIITVEITNRGAVFDMDILENLEEAPYNYDRDQLFDAVIPALTNSRGELVSLDNQFCPAGFAYNRELTKKYFGVEEPDEVYELVKDWDTFIETGLRLKEVAGDGVYMMQGMYDLLEVLVGQTTQDYIDGDNIDITARYQEAFEKACEIRDAGVPLGSNEKNSTSWNAAYTDGSVLFFNHASWSTNSCIASNDQEQATMGQWGFCMAPGGGWMNGGTSIGIYKDSPHKEEAWQIIQYFQGTIEGYTPIYDRLGWIPSFESFYEGEDAPINNDFLYADWFGGQNICKYIYDNIGIGIAPYEHVNAYSTTVTQCFNDTALQFLIDPDMTAEEGLQYLIQNVQTQEPGANIT